MLTYSWLHKGTYMCSNQLCLGQPTEAFVEYCMRRLAVLTTNGVKPVMVFDGGPLPQKAGTESDRKAYVIDMRRRVGGNMLTKLRSLQQARFQPGAGPGLLQGRQCDSGNAVLQER